MRIYSQNLQKQTPIFFSNRGLRARCAGPGSAFDLTIQPDFVQTSFS